MIRRPPRSTLFPSTTLSRSYVLLLSFVTHFRRRDHRERGPQRRTAADEPGDRVQHDERERIVDRHERRFRRRRAADRPEEHTSELQSPCNLVCRLLLEKKKR